MEMKHKQLKDDVDSCYFEINHYNKKLERLREECEHPKKYIEKGIYSWAPGHIDADALICGICGKALPQKKTGKNNGMVVTTSASTDKIEWHYHNQIATYDAATKKKKND